FPKIRANCRPLRSVHLVVLQIRFHFGQRPLRTGRPLRPASKRHVASDDRRTYG
uniref:Uncharacterized protein n=1 Tax=Romanomermis culicivorax TaxID=13658 RepID=A0A915KVC6_ROMCU